MSGKKTIVLSILLILIIVALIALKQCGIFVEIKEYIDKLIAPLKR